MKTRGRKPKYNFNIEEGNFVDLPIPEGKLPKSFQTSVSVCAISFAKKRNLNWMYSCRVISKEPPILRVTRIM